MLPHMTDIAADIAAIHRQEEALTLHTFSREAAWQLGSSARNLAAHRGHAIAIEICIAGAPVFLTALEGTTPNTLRWLRRKNNTVALFDEPTYRLSLRLQSKQQTLVRHALPEADYTSDGGGFPIRVASAGLVGAFAISGLDQRADHEFAVEALALYLGLDYASLALPTA